jgi:branched-chain amino acid transport system substrate-binding protein
VCEIARLRYFDDSGRGTIEAAKIAVEAYGGKVAGRFVEIVVADHHNKADVAAETTRRWFMSNGCVSLRV